MKNTMYVLLGITVSLAGNPPEKPPRTPATNVTKLEHALVKHILAVYGPLEVSAQSTATQQNVPLSPSVDLERLEMSWRTEQEKDAFFEEREKQLNRNSAFENLVIQSGQRTVSRETLPHHESIRRKVGKKK